MGNLQIFENDTEATPEDQFVAIQQSLNRTQQWAKTVRTNVSRTVLPTFTTTSATPVNFASIAFKIDVDLVRIDFNLDMTSGGTTGFEIAIDGQPIATVFDAITSRHQFYWTDSINLSSGRHVLSVRATTSAGTLTVHGGKIIVTTYPN